MQYEGISTLCFSSGRVGHKEENCAYTARPTKQTDDEDVIKEKMEAKKAMPNDNSYPTRKDFGPWNLVARKKKVSKEFRKETTQHSSFGHLSPLKASPSQTKSPPHSAFALLETENRDNGLNHVTSPTPNIFLADRTISSNGEDQPSLTQHHTSSKSHNKG